MRLLEYTLFKTIDVDIKNGLVDPVGKGEGGKNLQSSIDICTSCKTGS